MRFAALSTLLALGTVVSASALPRVLDAYDLAQPLLEEREVPLLKCESEPVYVGALKLVSSSGRELPAAFEGLRNADGYQQLDVEKAGQSARIENFAFTSCNSSFTGYQYEAGKAAEVFFGRLQPAHLQDKRCVSASRLASDNARLVAAKCSPSDDSGQLLQFWSLTKQPTGSGDGYDYYVNFLGKPAGDSEDFPGGYTLSKVTRGANKLVKLAFTEEEGARSPYFLKLA
ncbi:hypothetical protein BCV70DRAFT_113623 [Testicularia cyperi]|uniref:Ricin B lectin domain-containing protein n=1 Tax=Testicularia cyperi TaxID=1882483 RepID=A0A317XPT8_9BASI|nr:hypothetical protein BCV70DRAFT_113623 [Testicularia cyperi]